jgi:hypothetical protein
MTTAARRHPSAWALWPTLGASWIAFAHVLSFQGLAIWVIGGSGLCALVVLPLALARRRLLAIVAMAGMTLVVPALSEWLGGNTAGPVTRSSLMACAATGAMALILPTRYPVMMLPASLLLLGGSLGLGATTVVPWLAGLWAVAAALTVAMLGPYRQSHLRDRRRLVPFALFLMAAGLVAVAAIVMVTPLLSKPWTIPGAGVVAVPLAPPVPLVPTPEPTVPSSTAASSSEAASSSTATAIAPTAAPSVRPSPPVPDQEPAVVVAAQEQNQALSWLQLALLVLLLLLIVVFLLMVLWRAWVGIRWMVLRRRLSRGTREERAVGAWTWVRLRRYRYDMPLPVSASPDVAVDWAGRVGDPDVQRVARIAAKVAFNAGGSVARTDAKLAWTAARSAGQRPRGATLRMRWRWAGRLPRWVVRRMPPTTTSDVVTYREPVSTSRQR